jgi:hypothetical protein
MKIEGILGASGEYPFDLDERPFTSGELHLLKEISGVRAGELMEAMEAGDTDIMVALAMIVLNRHGKTVPLRLLWESTLGQLTFDFQSEPEEEDDDVPPKIGSGVIDVRSDSGDSSPMPLEEKPETTLRSTGVPH